MLHYNISGIEASGIGITVANINGGQIGGRRNLIINATVNQRNHHLHLMEIDRLDR